MICCGPSWTYASHPSIVWQGGTWQYLNRVAERRKRLAVRMLGGAWTYNPPPW